VEYLALMGEVKAEYAGDFLVTAATLMQIKARMLLPKTESQNEEVMAQEEADPRAELVERLLEYQKIREAAEELRQKREARDDLFARPLEASKYQPDYDAELSQALLLAEVSSFDLLCALHRVLHRLEERPVALVKREAFTLPDRLRGIAVRLYHSGELSFEALCDDCQSRLEVVVTFLAILELIRRGKARVRQLTLFDEIWLEEVISER
jgi:segregation and condensation protein A